jgi:hypothetical protein
METQGDDCRSVLLYRVLYAQKVGRYDNLDSVETKEEK